MESRDWNQLEVGQELEPLVKPAVEKVQLVKYAGASGDFNLIHTDVETARKVGLPGVIAHGMLSMGFLAQYAGQLAGTYGFVSRLKVRFKEMVFPGDILTCRGRVTAKEEHPRTVDLAIFAEREPGKVVTVGEATLTYY
ncbi:MaoC/PaaZ C-terminal domain-containing protein [Lihuaxuella thermophila]|uniref:MaoC like domain-containing protein n=1 Tax=Lihuaxuella thermophila TaxID=1173111 RepID=A0A1H8GFM8_9BACL|nr:MaoC/PaaZ C-terminal domain-containing protein [Lihuaxuella thermophila]SEN42763.1 MaoC like domain-containing protein [Lihuaxuella thermophila]